MYACHRSGFYVKKGERLRHLKTQGSNKINGICPSEILVKIQNDGTHNGIFIETHIGQHDNQLGHLNLTDSQRMDLASKIASKVPFASILDDIRDSVTGNNLERMHLLFRKDLHNTTQLFNLNNESVRHKDDAISIEAWSNVYKQLRTLLQERHPEAFLRMMQNFVNELLSTPQTSEFGRYFVQNYGDNVNAWVYCQRLHAGINTNMHTERMHYTIKYLYLEEKKAHRLDKTINKLMKFIKDKLFERLIIINKSTKVKDLRSKHKTNEERCVLVVNESNLEKKKEEEQLMQILSKSDKNLPLNKQEHQLNTEKEKLKTLHIQLIDKISTFEELEIFKTYSVHWPYFSSCSKKQRTKNKATSKCTKCPSQ
ncbi:hypothetical protein TcasGA2_TC004509 [Tribolium castaneum]|uniref:Uncharacterized protein n=1 Tax=Tribolium castaneum TaxID=7070 RepID=D6WC43_TRICA|nr:hypothetical protein TcasGA2_TC004509 [Tribolium castaneum]